MSRAAIIGLSALSHDTGSSLIDARDGSVIYALAEERLTNFKHARTFPIGTFRQALEIARSKGYEVTDLAISVDPALFITGRLATLIRPVIGDAEVADRFVADLAELLRFPDYYLASGYSFSTEYIEGMIDALDVSPASRESLRQHLSYHYNWAVHHQFVEVYCRQMLPHVKIHAVPHHTAHAASAFFGCGFPEATVLVVDGQGECDAVTIFGADGSGLRRVSSTGYPDSLGQFYLTCTEHLGFTEGDEYKVMGMAAYGSPEMFDMLAPSMSVSENGQLHLHKNDCFFLHNALFRFTRQFMSRLPRRNSKDPIGQAHFNFAASIQLLTEKIGVALANAAMSLTGTGNLVLTGGVALNGLMNDRIRRESPCAGLFVYPAASDEGTAVGAGQYLALGNGASPGPAMRSCFYGNSSTTAEVEQELVRRGMKYCKPENIAVTIAEALSHGKIVARFAGRSEYGPRALGNRSILADPRDEAMRDTLNRRIKHREMFRPFAPACLKEHAAEYFDLDCESPFMLLVCSVRDSARSLIPAVVHKDGTARVQTVDRDANPGFHEIIREFHRITGVPVVVNTSFNVNGEAIVDTPMDALDSFQFMDIDYLAIHDYWVAKADNPSEEFAASGREAYLELRRTRFFEQHREPLARLDLHRENAAQVAQALDTEPRRHSLANEPYRLGTTVSFTQNGDAANYQLAGWSFPEPWGTWSTGPSAMLEIPLGEVSAAGILMSCWARGFVWETHPVQLVDVVVNGAVVNCWRFSFTDDVPLQTAMIPAALLGNRHSLRIAFLTQETRSPQELGISEDARQLGIGLTSLTLSALEK